MVVPMFLPLVVGQAGLDPKTSEFLKIHAGGPGE